MTVLKIRRIINGNTSICKHGMSSLLLSTRRGIHNLNISSSESPNEEVTAKNQHEKLAEVMTPLWQVPYEEQLIIKYKWSKGVVQNIAVKLRVQAKGKKKSSFRPFTPYVEQVVPSPVTTAYRNKDELNVRTGVDGNPKTLGFFVGSPARGPAVCVPGTHIINMRQKHKDIAQAFEAYLQRSDLTACHDFKSGHWRSLLVRSTQSGETMAIAVLHPQNLTQERLEEEKDCLKSFFLQGDGRDCLPDSLYFQACRHTRCTHEQAPFEHLHGSTHLTEQLGPYKFRISPDAFFQVNTAAAEQLYDVVLRAAGVSSLSTLLDICCGTGTVSILASKRVRCAVGIDSVADAVRDAKHNAVANKVTNAEFFVGRVEKKLSRILRDLDLATDIVAVVNPGRGGVAPKVIHLLCSSPQIQRVVYVSCKADSGSTVANFVHLCLEGGFAMRRVVPVDLFPHTVHTELVMEFQR